MSEYRSAKVFVRDTLAGLLYEDDNGYVFSYDKKYLKMKDSTPVSLLLPLSEKEYTSKVLFSFFDGLIPEGWLLTKVCNNWKISEKDRFGLLLASCFDPIGCVSVREE